VLEEAKIALIAGRYGDQGILMRWISGLRRLY